jgi:hypothetical protein
MVVSLDVRDHIAPELSEPTAPSFTIPPTLDELDRTQPLEGTVLSYTVRRARHERRHPKPVTGDFENKI